MDISRKHDTKIVNEGLKDKDPLVREVAQNAANYIKKEQSDSWTRSARDRLIAETQKGNSDNARQVREDMIKHRGGRQGKGNRGELLTKAFHWTDGHWEKIYGGRNI